MLQGVTSVCSRSGRGFVFTLEAAVALLCFLTFASVLSSLSFEDYSDVALYKEASDYAQIAMKMHCEHNETCLAQLREMLGREATGEKCATVRRTAVTPAVTYEDANFTLCA